MTATKLWIDINKYVDAYTAENQEELSSDWLIKWYDYYTTGEMHNKEMPYQVHAVNITGNPYASVHKIVCCLLNLIPELRNYLIIHEVSSTGNISY